MEKSKTRKMTVIPEEAYLSLKKAADTSIKYCNQEQIGKNNQTKTAKSLEPMPREIAPPSTKIRKRKQKMQQLPEIPGMRERT